MSEHVESSEQIGDEINSALPDDQGNSALPDDQDKSSPKPRTSWLRGSAWRTLAMILGIKVVFYIYGTQALQVLLNRPVGGFQKWLDMWTQWDAVHYMKLAEEGYQATGDARFLLVFYPLLPWLTRFVALFFGNYRLSGLIVANIASIAAGLLLLRLAQLDYSKKFAERAVWFMFIFPTSYVLHTPFSESLLLALALGSFLAARKDRWWLAGVLGALACLSRISGMLLIPALAVEAGHQYWLNKKWRWSWLWIFFIAVGVGGYLLLNYKVAGDPLIFLAYRRQNWFAALDWPWIGIKFKLADAMISTGERWVTVNSQELFFIALGLISSVFAFIKLRPSYGIWMILNWLLFTSTRFLLGTPRYTLVMFPLFFLFAMLSTRRFWYSIITVWSLLFLSFFTALYVSSHWIY